MHQYTRYFVLFVLILLLGNGVTGRKKRKSGDKNVRKPEIEPSFLKINAKLNQSVCIPCKLKTKYQEPSNAILIAWYKDGSPIKVNLNRHYKQEEDCLRIEKVNSYDHGKYQCKGFNWLGSTEAVRFLNVTNRLPLSILPALPTVKIRQRTDIPYIFRDTIEVIKPLVRKTVALGKKMKIRCLLKGEPTPEVHWMFKGRLIVKNKKHRLRDRNKILVIKKFSSADVGKYTCIGSNPAGKVNMTWVVTLKRKPRPSPTPPAVKVTKLLVKQGQNLTLTCKVPANEIRYLIWNVPSRPTTDNSVERGFRSGDLARDLREKTQHHFLKKGFTRNGTRVEKSILLNATKEIHEGVYKCVGLFERQTKVQTIKVVEVIVETNSPLQRSGSSDKNEFPLNVVLPAACVAFFLLVLFLCICFVFRQKSRQSKSLLIPIVPPPTQPTLDGEVEDSSNMQILPMCNYDSLKTNSSNNRSNRSSQRTSTGTIQGDENNKLVVRTTVNVDYNNDNLQTSCKNSTNSIPNSSSSISSLSNHTNKSNNSTNNVVTQLLADTSHTSPTFTRDKSPLDSDNIEDSSHYGEDERLLVEHSNTAPTCRYSRHSSNIDTHGVDPPPDNEAVEEQTPCLVEKGCDLNVQRKMKNWEPLMRTSCPVAVETRAVEEKLRSP